ncbi:jg13997 [Pararge aegeria aegeria]|uniref:Jg13997 protein n=1 Tax=Pararge aegeria aegeria TaxID=348720 RepID=A0A8S4RAD0_9NEOP|nr:jg13997 [Pararge aegeria aegeria]
MCEATKSHWSSVVGLCSKTFSPMREHSQQCEVHILKMIFLLCVAGSLLFESEARPKPDSAGHAPLPGPGLSYGGIPYGSVSGNVAEYFRGRPSAGHGGALRGADVEYAPIEQYL